MVRPAGSFFSCSASLAVVGLASLRRVSSTWTVPVGEVHLAPEASLVSCGTSFVGMPSRAPVAGSVTIRAFPADDQSAVLIVHDPGDDDEDAIALEIAQGTGEISEF